jgi:predicted nucleotidyltransferase
MSHPVEGWIVETNLLGLRELWVVRGYRHPHGYLVVSPYVMGGRRVKQYDWGSVPGWLLSYIPCIGRTAPLMPMGRVLRTVDPESVLRVRRNDLPPAVIELLDIMGPEWAGITGSWAVMGESPGSDVDLLVYGNHWEMYRALLDLRSEGKVKPCMVAERYSKVMDKISWSSYSKLVEHRVLDSCYKGIPYTIRILRRLDVEPCEGMVARIGVYRGPFRVVEAVEPHLTPARYLVEIGGVEVLMETWHTRFMELPKGLYRGYLELFYERGVTIASPDIVGSIEGPL